MTGLKFIVTTLKFVYLWLKNNVPIQFAHKTINLIPKIPNQPLVA